MVVCVPNTDGLEEKVVVAWPSTRKQEVPAGGSDAGGRIEDGERRWWWW